MKHERDAHSKVITGAKIGNYHIGPLLAAGPHARCYVANETAPARAGARCAIKVLRPGVAAHGAFRELFNRETAIVRRFAHPNLERHLDSGELAGEPFRAIDLVEGVTLAELATTLYPRAWPSSALIELARDVLDALSHAHALELPHGSVTGDVIRISRSGRVVLTGFALPSLRCHAAAPRYAASRAPSRETTVLLGGKSPTVAERILDDVRCAGLVFAELIDNSRTGMPRELVELVRAMVSPSRASRPNTAEALRVLTVLDQSSRGRFPLRRLLAQHGLVEPTARRKGEPAFAGRLGCSYPPASLANVLDTELRTKTMVAPEAESADTEITPAFSLPSIARPSPSLRPSPLGAGVISTLLLAAAALGAFVSVALAAN